MIPAETRQRWASWRVAYHSNPTGGVMRNTTTAKLLTVLSLITSSGCGGNRSEPIPEGGKTGKLTANSTPSQAATGEATADLERQIADKEKELADLRKKADSLRAQPAEVAQPVSLQKLLDGIPKDSQPQPEEDRVIERSKANQWVQKHLVGKPVTFSVQVGHVQLVPEGDGYSGWVDLGKRATTSTNYHGEVQCGGSSWKVYLGIPRFANLNESDAKRLRELKGKTVKFQGVFSEEARFGPGPSPPGFLLRETTSTPERVFLVTLKGATLDGIDLK